MSDEWVETTLGQLAEWRGGLTPSMSRPDFWTDGDIPWISSKEVVGGTLSSTEKRVTAKALDETSLRLVEPGSVVVVVRSGILLHTFPVAFVPFATTVNQDVKAASPVAGVDGRFLAYLIESCGSDILQRYRKTGTTVQSVDVPALLKHEVRRPPLPVQRRIVDLMTHLDGHLANLRAERDTLQNLLGVTASNWDWQHVPDVVRLEEVARMYQPKTLAKAELVEGGPFPVFGANGPIGFHDEFNHEDSQVAVTCRGATCGRVNWTPPNCWITGNAMVVSPLENGRLDQRYLYWALQFLTDVSVTVSGSAQPQITRTSLAPLKIPLPSVKEQQMLAQTLDHLKESGHHLGVEARTLQDLRNGLLSKALNADIEISHSYDQVRESVA